MISKVGVPTLARGSARLPPSQRSGSVSLSLSFPLSSFHCVFSLSSFSPSVSSLPVRLSSEPAHLHPGRCGGPFGPFSGDTITQLCEQTNAV